MRRALLLLVLLPLHAQVADALRYGHEQDLDILDPARNGSYDEGVVQRHVRPVGGCRPAADLRAPARDRLAPDLTLRPDVSSQEGTLLDAAAVKLNLDRYRTAPESLGKFELAPVVGVDVTGPLSPQVLTLPPDQIAVHLGCAGPFRFMSGVAQDRIVLKRFPDYWNAWPVRWTGRSSGSRRTRWCAGSTCRARVTGLMPRPDGKLRHEGVKVTG